MEPLTPLWIATGPGTTFDAVADPLDADVAVLGGGIAGLTTALLLQEQGADVAVIEADRIGLGATARATVKVTAGHGLRYTQIARRHGEDAARTYAEANVAAIGSIGSIVTRHAVDCSFERRRHIVCAEDEQTRRQLLEEVELERKIGLPVSFAPSSDLPLDVAGCLVMDEQAQFHPRRYLLGLADAFVRAGGAIFEGSRATRIEDHGSCTVEVNGTAIRADDVVVATGAPISDRGLLAARMTPFQEYGVAAEISNDDAPSDMYLSATDGAWSVRSAVIGEHTYLIVSARSMKSDDRQKAVIPIRPLRLDALAFSPSERRPISGRRVISGRTMLFRTPVSINRDASVTDSRLPYQTSRRRVSSPLSFADRPAGCLGQFNATEPRSTSASRSP